MEHIGQKIKELRKKADLTQERLANYISVSAQAVSKWELGQTAPDLSLIAPLCRALGCSADELLGIVEEDSEEIKAMIDELQLIAMQPENIRKIAQIAAEKYPRNERLSLAIATAERLSNTKDEEDRIPIFRTPPPLLTDGAKIPFHGDTSIQTHMNSTRRRIFWRF